MRSVASAVFSRRLDGAGNEARARHRSRSQNEGRGKLMRHSRLTKALSSCAEQNAISVATT